MQILIIKLGAIGDVLRTTPLAAALKEKYQGAEIDWVTKENAFDLLKNNPNIDNIFSIEKNLQKKYDIVINLDDEESACKLASSIQKNKLVGAYIENGRRTYTNDSAPWFDMGLISKFGKKRADELKALNKKTYQEILFKNLNIKNKNYEPQLNLQNEGLKFSKAFAENNDIGKKDLVIGINTGAGGRWQDKKLGIEKTIDLINRLNNEIKNVKLVLFGGPEEKHRNKKILEGVKTKIIDAGCNNTLMEFASLINLCRILITSDSLAMHLGIALKKKVVVFFYVTSSTEIELYGRGIKIIGKGKDYCSYKPKCDYPPKWDIDEFVSAVKVLSK